MKIVADENIPGAVEAFSRFGQVVLFEGRRIDTSALDGAEVLLVRSVTAVGRELLHGSAIRFVGSATIGTDHVDVAYLREHRIAFAHAPGSNAGSVAEYVIAALLVLALDDGRELAGRTLGVVGYGNTGRRVAARAAALGVDLLINDPPLAEQRVLPLETASLVSLDELLARSDVVSCHVPLTDAGEHPTRHLLSEQELMRMKADSALINTSRGGVVAGDSLQRVLEARSYARAVLDVFEGEPTPSTGLVARAFLATPHIAGHSYDGKLKGTRMLFEALCAFLQVPPPVARPRFDAPERAGTLQPPASGDGVAWLDALVRQMYDIRGDDRRMRQMLELPPREHASWFTALRTKYPPRRAFERFEVPRASVPVSLRQAVSQGLKVRLA